VGDVGTGLLLTGLRGGSFALWGFVVSSNVASLGSGRDSRLAAVLG
jgi:hypothetical protein